MPASLEVASAHSPGSVSDVDSGLDLVSREHPQLDARRNEVRHALRHSLLQLVFDGRGAGKSQQRVRGARLDDATSTSHPTMQRFFSTESAASASLASLSSSDDWAASQLRWKRSNSFLRATVVGHEEDLSGGIISNRVGASAGGPGEDSLRHHQSAKAVRREGVQLLHQLRFRRL